MCPGHTPESDKRVSEHPVTVVFPVCLLLLFAADITTVFYANFYYISSAPVLIFQTSP